MANKAVFFDRDGTLNVDTHYLYKKEEFVWIEDAQAAIRLANDAGYKVIVITNQSGIARGYYEEADVRALHAWMNDELRGVGAHIDAFYYCPHHVDGKVARYTRTCDCRKPGTALVDAACEAFDIDRAASLFIGDSDVDVDCATRANICALRYTGGSLLALLQSAMGA